MLKILPVLDDYIPREYKLSHKSDGTTDHDRLVCGMQCKGQSYNLGESIYWLTF